MDPKTKTATPAPANAPTAATVATKAVNVKAPRVVPSIIGISSAVSMPTNIASARGSKSLYPFDTLEIGQSIAIKNKTAADLSSVISARNRKASNFAQKIENGVPVFKMVDVKDANGAVVGTQSSGEPVMEQVKTFFAHDCDKNDPDGASVRIWRSK